jgi:hypothetical protein
VPGVSDVDIQVWLGCAYAGFLVLVAYALDLVAKRTSRRSADWQSGSFTYHEDHDAWVCPQDQWLWPQSFDPHSRVMRYRARPTVCNACPVKDTCTSSDDGREISRPIDPWPHSEAGRFHRGIACAVTVIGLLLPLALIVGRSAAEAGVLLAAAAVTGLASWPLWRSFRNAPAGFPEHVPQRTRVVTSLPEATSTDRFTTRWGSTSKPTNPTDDSAGWSRINRS